MVALSCLVLSGTLVVLPVVYLVTLLPAQLVRTKMLVLPLHAALVQLVRFVQMKVLRFPFFAHLVEFALCPDR